MPELPLPFRLFHEHCYGITAASVCTSGIHWRAELYGIRYANMTEKDGRDMKWSAVEQMILPVCNRLPKEDRVVYPQTGYVPV